MHKHLIDLPEKMETDRLVVRPYRAGDGAAYFDVCQRNKAHLVRFEGDNPIHAVTTLEEAEILVRDFAVDWARRSAFFLGCWCKETGAFAAQIYIGPLDWHRPAFMIGYFADVDHEGQGYVTEGVRAALRLCFEVLGASRVRLECNELNQRSLRLAERVGFRREGHIRETHPNRLRPDGRPSGDLIYGLLRREYHEMTA
jgi:[ribosomal protein S5]-alanine N-acetyltransferase